MSSTKCDLYSVIHNFVVNVKYIQYNVNEVRTMFKDKIKWLRRQHGLTQKQLAEIVGVDVSSVGKWEGKGSVLPSDGVRERIANYFNVSVDYLMGYTDVPSKLEGTAAEAELISCFRSLNDKGQEAALEVLRGFAKSPAYTKTPAEKAI